MRDVTLARIDLRLSSTIINFELVHILMELMRVFATGGNIHSTLSNFQHGTSGYENSCSHLTGWHEN